MTEPDLDLGQREISEELSYALDGRRLVTGRIPDDQKLQAACAYF